MEFTQKLAWLLIVLGLGAVFLSLYLGKKINHFKSHDSKRWLSVVLFFVGAALAVIGLNLLK